MVNFNEIANQKIADVERPPLLPIGTYECIVVKHPEKDSFESKKGETFDTLDFTLKVVSAIDVDDEDIAAYEGDLQKQTLRHRFMFNNDDANAFQKSLFGLRKFLTDHLQIDGAEGLSIDEALAASVNCRCAVEVKWRPDQNDPEVQYTDIKRTAPLP